MWQSRKKLKRYAWFLLFFLSLFVLGLAMIPLIARGETNYEVSEKIKLELLTSIKQARQELANIKEQLQTSQIDLKQAKEQLTELKRQYQPVIQQLETLKTQSQDLKQSLEEWKQLSEDLKKQISKLVWQRNIAVIWAAVSTVAYFIK